MTQRSQLRTRNFGRVIKGLCEIRVTLLSRYHLETYKSLMDRIFKALGDPSRRALLDALRARDGQTLGELETLLDLSRFGVMKHLGVLEEAGLITTIRRGRFKHHYLNALPLQEAIDRWIEPLLVKPAARGLIDLKARLQGAAQMLDGQETEKPDFVLQTSIRCTPEALWGAIADPEVIGQHHFMGADVALVDGVQEWSRGDAVFMKMTVLERDPPKRLVTTFEPQMTEAVPPSRVETVIRQEGDVCILTLSHFELANDVVPGTGVHDGWSRWAASLKTFLETGKPLPPDTTRG